MENINRTIFLFINGLAGNPFWDGLNCFVATISPYIYALFLVVFYLRGKRDKALYAFYSALFALTINLLITFFYFHPRPFMVGLGRALLKHSPETSFPSDHTTLAFSIALYFLLEKEWRTGLFLFLFALFTGFARVYVGVHFPLDIIGSLVVSLVASISIILLKDYLYKLNSFLNNLYDNVMALLLK
jgi:undecaprenyl-diphosphatase